MKYQRWGFGFMWQLIQASGPMLLPFCSSSPRRNCSLFSLLPYGKKSAYTFCKTELAHFLLHLSSYLLSTTHSHVWFLQLGLGGTLVEKSGSQVRQT